MHRYFIYEKLKRSLLEEMASGDWRSGQRFLSVRVIIRRWKVSRPTACASLQMLREEGLLVVSPRRGYFLGQDFQEKAQLLLRRNRTPPAQPPLPIEQKARLLRGVRGGRVALLLEAVQPSMGPAATVTQGSGMTIELPETQEILFFKGRRKMRGARRMALTRASWAALR